MITKIKLKKGEISRHIQKKFNDEDIYRKLYQLME